MSLVSTHPSFGKVEQQMSALLASLFDVELKRRSVDDDDYEDGFDLEEEDDEDLDEDDEFEDDDYDEDDDDEDDLDSIGYDDEE